MSRVTSTTKSAPTVFKSSLPFTSPLGSYDVPLLPHRNAADRTGRFELRSVALCPTLLFLLLPFAFTIYISLNRASEIGPTWFALHPICMLSALIAMVGSIIAGKTQGPERPGIQNIFAILAWLLAVFGAYVVFTTKQQYRKPHFLTPHSHLGLVTFTSLMGYTVASCFRNPRGKNTQRTQMQHINFGRLVIILGLITAIAGVLELEPSAIPNALLWISSFGCFVPPLIA